METPCIIQMKDVVKRFGSKTILNGANLRVPKGKTTVIIGKSGAGKSVLLKCIAGLLQSDAGQVLFEGVDMNKLSTRKRAERRSRLSYMFQNNALFDSMTAFDNVALPLRETTRLSEKTITEKVSALLKKIDLVDMGHKFPSELSGGMQKRVALARALVTEPDIVLFDEPTAGLDPIRKNTVFALIKHSQEIFAFTAIVVTHELPDALYVADEVAVLDAGKISFQGPPLVFEHEGGDLAQLFLQSEQSLIKNVLGIQPISAFLDNFDALQNAKPIWCLMSLVNYTEIIDTVGKLTAHVVLEILVNATREMPNIKGKLFLVNYHSLLICLEDGTLGKETFLQVLIPHLHQCFRSKLNALSDQSIDFEIACSYDAGRITYQPMDLIAHLKQNLEIVYTQKSSS